MRRSIDGMVVVITGASAGIGRALAEELSRRGAKLALAARRLDRLEELNRALGGGHLCVHTDVSVREECEDLVARAVEHFGRIDTLVCNAGIVRDRMIVNMSVDEWDAVVKVHLRGMFCPTRHAIDFWRAQSKAGAPVAARLVTTSSGAGLFGSVSQANYAAAKAGIAAFTITAAAELGRYGILANGIAPSARSRMTEEAFAEMMKKPESGFDAMDPANVSPVVVWLGSEACNVTGRMFETQGGELSVADGWQHGKVHDKGARYEPGEVGDVVAQLIAEAPTPGDVYGA